MTIDRLFLPARLALFLGTLSLLSLLPNTEAATVTVRANQPGPGINKAMWGVFFEDINFGADGGLYAELVKNGAFEFPEPLMGWTKVCPDGSKGAVEISTNSPIKPANPHFARL